MKRVKLWKCENRLHVTWICCCLLTRAPSYGSQYQSHHQRISPPPRHIKGHQIIRRNNWQMILWQEGVFLGSALSSLSPPVHFPGEGDDRLVRFPDWLESRYNGLGNLTWWCSWNMQKNSQLWANPIVFYRSDKLQQRLWWRQLWEVLLIQLKFVTLCFSVNHLSQFPLAQKAIKLWFSCAQIFNLIIMLSGIQVTSCMVWRMTWWVNGQLHWK